MTLKRRRQNTLCRDKNNQTKSKSTQNSLNIYHVYPSKNELIRKNTRAYEFYLDQHHLLQKRITEETMELDFYALKDKSLIR